jgi:DNA replicative helicase MCM subunit Mcm2 (Cdc46/Mcm family)
MTTAAELNSSAVCTLMLHQQQCAAKLFSYPEPVPACPSHPCRKDWTLLRDDSIFVDWQRLKVQENVEEVRHRQQAAAGMLCSKSEAASTPGVQQWIMS